jgi:EAL domain-containing protein (putative c-di-GMP-specific phosphodiesterase class I)/CheY-like chemotaxis protein
LVHRIVNAITSMTDMAAPSSPPKPADAIVASPPLAASAAAPLCYVVDEEASIRHFLSLVLHGSGVDTMEFADGAALRRALENRIPDLVFHNIALDAADAVESVVALGKRDFRGSVQLMSNRGAAVLEHVKNIGSQQHISMLPVLKKPFETDAIVKILHELKIGMPAGAGARLSLDEALDKNWIEFWYQPKIALRKKQLAGAEAYARARHPQNGVVMPAAFMPDASDAAVLRLSELALHSALKAGQNFSKMGIHLRLTVNIPLAALAKLPIEQIVTSQRPSPDNWPGLIIDVPEDQIVADLPLAVELAKKLEAINVRMSIDDCGRAYSMLSGLAEFPFTEVKLDRAFVADCATDKVNAPLCKAMINLAHHFGRTAVAMGIEKAPDAVAMVSMGCDFGQGFLLGLPMAEERFISLLRQRSGVKAEQPAAAG